MTDRFSMLVIDRLGDASLADTKLPQGKNRFCGRHHPFADNPADAASLCAALGYAEDLRILLSHPVDQIQIEIGPMQWATINPVMQFVNDQPVYSGHNGTSHLRYLVAAKTALESKTARLFLART